MPGRVAAVVLAGGESLRFGADKLSQSLGTGTVLEAALGGLPLGADVILVGPASTRSGPGARWVREQPAGGGPAAGIVSGLRAALEGAPDAVVVLPGDAPLAGQAAAELLAELTADPELLAVVGVDQDGRCQPLQLALRAGAAYALIEAAGASGAAGGSARALLGALDPPPRERRLRSEQLFDIDTRDQLTVWTLRESGPVTRLVDAVRRRAAERPGRPVVVALDGPSGAGKSTLAAALQLRTDGVVIPGDDFYAPGLATTTASERDSWADGAVVDGVFDWHRLRAEALAPLAAGRPATYRPYDWHAGDGRLGRSQRLASQPVVILEGVYAGRPQFADLVDLGVYVDIDPAVREARLADRGDPEGWPQFWDRGERFYFDRVRPPAGFDLVVATRDD
ncbi:MAG TPA: NTP transferase domain-containing protein [Propionibacteriaceae bacterium]